MALGLVLQGKKFGRSTGPANELVEGLKHEETSLGPVFADHGACVHAGAGVCGKRFGRQEDASRPCRSGYEAAVSVGGARRDQLLRHHHHRQSKSNCDREIKSGNTHRNCRHDITIIKWHIYT